MNNTYIEYNKKIKPINIFGKIYFLLMLYIRTLVNIFNYFDECYLAYLIHAV